MKQLKQLRIVIDEEGNPEVSIKGVKGAACKEATRAIEEALGEVVSSTPTAEMYQKETVANVAKY